MARCLPTRRNSPSASSSSMRRISISYHSVRYAVLVNCRRPSACTPGLTVAVCTVGSQSSTNMTAVMNRFSCIEAPVGSSSRSSYRPRSRTSNVYRNTHWLPLPQSGSGDSDVASIRSTVPQLPQSASTKFIGASPTVAGRSVGLSGTAAGTAVFASASARHCVVPF